MNVCFELYKRELQENPLGAQTETSPKYNLLTPDMSLTMDI